MGEAKRRKSRSDDAALGWPENLRKLHAAEEDLRLRGLGMVKGDEDLTRQIRLIETVMDFLQRYLNTHETTDPDEITVQHLGVRVFNAAAAALKLALGGYGQVSAGILRDILETTFLVDSFRTDRSRIAEWRNITEDKRGQAFGADAVRRYLDVRDKYTERRRRQAYMDLCRMGTHPTVQGFALLRAGDTGTPPGPFLASNILAATINELAKLMVEVGETFEAFLPNDGPSAIEAKTLLMEETGRWLERYYGVPYDEGPVREVRGLLTKLRASS